jgi:hypothetical protein
VSEHGEGSEEGGGELGDGEDKEETTELAEGGGGMRWRSFAY